MDLNCLFTLRYNRSFVVVHYVHLQYVIAVENERLNTIKTDFNVLTVEKTVVLVFIKTIPQKRKEIF